MVRVIHEVSDLTAGTDKVLLLCSGGFDSSLVAMLLLDHGVSYQPLTFLYPDRPTEELRTCERILSDLGAPTPIVHELGLHDARTLRRELLDSRYEAWMPFRNLIFFGLAAHYAIIHACNVVSAGTRVWDTTAYGDASPTYLSTLASLLQYSGLPDDPMTIESLFLPLLHSDAIAAHYMRLGDHRTALLKRSWSCWRANNTPCGQCAPCKTRSRFLLANNLVE